MVGSFRQIFADFWGIRRDLVALPSQPPAMLGQEVVQ
jgi:hypothetical protein